MKNETNMASALQKPTGLKEYKAFLQDIKNKIVESRINAAKSVNQAFIGMYWFIGQMIVEKQQQLGWGKSVVEMLSNDLKNSFPEMAGFSPQNLWLTRQFYLEYSTSPILQQLVGEIPRGHNVLIVQKVKGEAQRRYYLESTAKLGWTRDVLLNQIKAKAFEHSLLEKSHNSGLMGILFEVSVPTINEHLSNIFKSRELRESATIRKFRIVQTGSSAIGQQLVAQFENESSQHTDKFVKQDKWFIYFEKSQQVVDQLSKSFGDIILSSSPKTCQKSFVHNRKVSKRLTLS